MNKNTQNTEATWERLAQTVQAQKYNQTSSTDDFVEEVETNPSKSIKHGAIWLILGLVATAVSYQMAIESGTIIVFEGAIIGGFAQMMYGFAERFDIL